MNISLFPMAGFLMSERICDLCFTLMYTMWNDTGFNTKTQTSKNRGQQQLEIVHPYKRFILGCDLLVIMATGLCMSEE